MDLSNVHTYIAHTYILHYRQCKCTKCKCKGGQGAGLTSSHTHVRIVKVAVKKSATFEVTNLANATNAIADQRHTSFYRPR